MSWVLLMGVLPLAFVLVGGLVTHLVLPGDRSASRLVLAVVLSIATTIAAAVALSGTGIRVTGPHVLGVVGALCAVLLLGTVLLRRRLRWSVRRPSLQRGLGLLVPLVALVVTTTVLARAQRPTDGEPHSMLELDGAIAATGQLVLTPNQSADVPVRLISAGTVQDRTLTVQTDQDAPQRGRLEPDTGGYRGTAVVTAPGRPGDYRVLISVANPTWVAAPTPSDPLTVSGPAAELVNSARRLTVQLVLRVTP